MGSVEARVTECGFYDRGGRRVRALLDVALDEVDPEPTASSGADRCISEPAERIERALGRELLADLAEGVGIDVVEVADHGSHGLLECVDVMRLERRVDALDSLHAPNPPSVDPRR